MKTCTPFEAKIYVGLKRGYEIQFNYDNYKVAYEVIQKYCNRVGLGVTVQLTKFIYTNGNEPGLVEFFEWRKKNGL